MKNATCDVSAGVALPASFHGCIASMYLFASRTSRQIASSARDGAIASSAVAASRTALPATNTSRASASRAASSASFFGLPAAASIRRGTSVRLRLTRLPRSFASSAL